MIIKLFLAGVCALLDRLRGDDRGPGGVLEAALMGACLWLIATDYEFSHGLLYFAIAWAAGSAPGWGFVGTIMSRRGWYPFEQDEWWQVGPIAAGPWQSAFARGLLWALPALSVSYWYAAALIPAAAMLIAFPLSLWIAREYIDDTPLIISDREIARGRWGKMELVRGGLCGVLTLIFSIVLVVI